MTPKINHKNIPSQYQAGTALRIFILFIIMMLSVAGSIGYYAYWLGHRMGSDSLGKTAQAYHKLKSDQTTNLVKLTKIQEEFLKANQERDVSLRNLKGMRDSLEISRKRIDFLVSQRDAFQAMIAEEIKEESLQVFSQSIKPLPENAFEYAFDLVLVKPKGVPARTINVDLTLLDGEAIVKVPLEDSTYAIDGFKRIQGRFIMPKGFTPRKLRLSISGVGSQNIEQYYNWRKGKRLKSMPQSLISVPPLENLDDATFEKITNKDSKKDNDSKEETKADSTTDNKEDSKKENE